MSKKIDALRARIGVLSAEADALQSAPMSRPEKCAEVTEQCKAWATDGERRLAHHVMHGDNANEWLVVRPGPSGRIDMGPLLAALLGAEGLANALNRFAADLPAGPDAATRAKRTGELEVELFRLECDEEALIEASEAAGTPVARRADADPRAVLGVAE